MIWLVVAVLLMLPVPSLAQEQFLGQLQVPQPVSELFDTFGKIRIDFSGIPIINKAFQSFGQAVQNPEETTSKLPGFIDNAESWFRTNVGVSFGEIAKAIGDFIVWVLELIVKLIKAGISVIAS